MRKMFHVLAILLISSARIYADSQYPVKLDPTSAVAHFRLSTIYRQMGRAEDAKREIAEYQKYKDMKEKLRDVYRQMRLEPDKKVHEDEDARQQ